MLQTITLETTAKEEVIDITDQVARIVAEAQVEEAGVFVYVPHGDAAVNIQAGRPKTSEPPLNDLLKKVLEREEFEKPETGAALCGSHRGPHRPPGQAPSWGGPANLLLRVQRSKEAFGVRPRHSLFRPLGN
jgi:hypothetical protein